jgi:transposase
VSGFDLGERVQTLRFLIRDRDALFTTTFDTVFTAETIRMLKSPPQAPRANAICERMVGTLRRELLDRILIVNEPHVRRVLDAYLIHYNGHRPHRTLGQRPPTATLPAMPPATGPILRRRILNGLINEYHQAA